VGEEEKEKEDSCMDVVTGKTHLRSQQGRTLGEKRPSFSKGGERNGLAPPTRLPKIRKSAKPRELQEEPPRWEC